MKVDFFKYQGAGNDFVIVDNRNKISGLDDKNYVAQICDRRFGIGADGFMLLENHDEFDFNMRYFNADGGEASMCGNGGRCIVAFAKRLNVISEYTTFLAVDGVHKATLEGELVNLQMIDVDKIIDTPEYCFLNTGSPHYVTFVDDVDKVDVYNEGKRIRNDKTITKDGTNVNFIHSSEDCLFVRTYERGVEDETLACGTGVVASVIAAYKKGLIKEPKSRVIVKGGEIEVSFIENEGVYSEIWMKGPAEFVFSGVIEL